MFECHYCGFRNPALLKVKKTKERFDSAYEYIKINKRVPRPCVLMTGTSGYSIFDGNHRLGAMHASEHEIFGRYILDAWVGDAVATAASTISALIR